MSGTKDCVLAFVKDTPRFYRHVKTLFVCAASIGFGLSWSLLGPTIPDLCLRMGVSVKEISWALSLRSFLTMATCPVIGVVLEKVAREDLVVGVAMLTLALTRFIIPFCSVLWIYVIAAYFEIICYNTSEIAIDVMVLKMWGKDADPSISAWHLSFCIGFAVGPLIVLPFLRENTEADPSINGYQNTTSASDVELVSSPIEYPYIIIGIYILIIAIISFIFHVMPNPTIKKDVDSGQGKTKVIDILTLKELRELKIPRMTLISLSFFFFSYYFCAGGLGATFHTFLFTYSSKSNLGFTKHESAMLDFANKMALVVGRIVTTPISKWVPVQILIFIEVFGAFIFIIPLMLLSEKAKIYVWVFTFIFNLFLAPEWGSGISWMDKYVPLTASLMTLVILAENVSAVVFQYASGAILTDYTPMHLMYMFVAIGGLHCVVLVCMQIVGSRQGVRYKDDVIEEKDVKVPIGFSYGSLNLKQEELEKFLKDDLVGKISVV